MIGILYDLLCEIAYIYVKLSIYDKI